MNEYPESVKKKWETVIQEYKFGQVVKVKIARLEPFGIFLDFGEFPGRGFCNIPEIIEVAPPYNFFPKVGDEIDAIIVGIAEHSYQIQFSFLRKNFERYGATYTVDKGFFIHKFDPNKH